MRREVEALEKQISALNRKVDELKKMVQILEKERKKKAPPAAEFK